jgi:hypothetical protein
MSSCTASSEVILDLDGVSERGTSVPVIIKKQTKANKKSIQFADVTEAARTGIALVLSNIRVYTNFLN